MANKKTAPTWSNTDAYEAIVGRWSRRAAHTALAWLDQPAGLTWLDLGCGTGALTEQILATAAPSAVVGVDPSAEFLAEARSRISDDRVRFAVGSAVELPLTSQSVDIVVSGLVLHFVADHQSAFAEMIRVARPGGTVAGYTWAQTREDQFTQPFWRAAFELDPDAAAWELGRTYTLRDREGFERIFTGSALQRVSTDELSFPVHFQDFDDYWQPCLLSGNSPIQKYAGTLSAERRDALREHLRTILPIANDGSIPLQGHLWIASGVTPSNAGARA